MSHGVRRQRESPEKEAARIEKEKTLVIEYRTLVEDVMTRRHANDFSKEAFNQTTALLKRNPEFYTIWNYRRRILLQGLFTEYPPTHAASPLLSARRCHKDVINGRSPEQKRPILVAELQFLFLRLREYPKCYWIWLYRKWCLEICPEADWNTELTLVTKLLEADARNFHGWEYRRYVVASIEKVKGISLAKKEFDYTTTKTNNISNFSAWHNRANLIPKLLPSPTLDTFDHERQKLLQTELKRTHNGLWVDPDDQSTWLYHQWLLGETFTLHQHQRQQQQQPINYPILAPTSKEEKISVLEGEIKMLKELLQEEPGSKWCLFSLAVYKLALMRVMGTETAANAEVIEMIKTLEKDDQMRAGHYKAWRCALEQGS